MKEKIGGVPEKAQSLKEKYLSKADKDGFIEVAAFALEELGRQNKNICGFFDESEKNEDFENIIKEIRWKGSAGNYDVKIHIDDMDDFVSRVKKYYGDV